MKVISYNWVKQTNKKDSCQVFNHLIKAYKHKNVTDFLEIIFDHYLKIKSKITLGKC